jgi:hypothetical protein
MKIVRTDLLIDAGAVSKSTEWQIRYDEITKAIKAIDWPPGSGSFTLYDEPGKKRGMGNGVTPIKMACMSQLKDNFGWDLETGINVGTVKLKGGVDATCPMAERLSRSAAVTYSAADSITPMNPPATSGFRTLRPRSATPTLFLKQAKTASQFVRAFCARRSDIVRASIFVWAMNRQKGLASMRQESLRGGGR